MEFDVEKLSELEQKAQEFLDENNSPKTQFEITVSFGYGKEPDYGLGDKVRVADPETGIVTTTRIMAEAREYSEDGLSVYLELGKAEFTFAKAIGGSKPKDGEDGKPGKPGKDGTDGQDAPHVIVRYAVTSGGPWYTDYVIGRKWMQTSTDGGVTWSEPKKFVGEDGAKGEPGPGIAYQGTWEDGKSYIGTDKRKDVIQGSDGKYYLCRTSHTAAVGTEPTTGMSWPNYWDFFEETFESVATKLLLAEDASITKTLNVGQGGTSRAGVSGEGNYRFWAGSEVPGEAPYSVTEDGKLKATDGEFQGTVQSTDDDGNYSLLSAGRLAFYKVDPVTGDETQSHYASRIEAGTASDGQKINIDFDYPPKVLVSPNKIKLPSWRELRDYQENVWDEEQQETVTIYHNPQIEAYATNITDKGFNVWCRLVNANKSVSETVDVSRYLTEDVPAHISGYNTEPINSIEVILRFIGYVTMYDYTKVYFIFWYDIEYQKQGSSTWVKVVDNERTRIEIESGFSFVGYRDKSRDEYIYRQFTVPEPGIYRVRATRKEVRYGPAYHPNDFPPYNYSTTTRFMRWEGTGVTVLQTGQASYIAIEGGE